MESTLTTGDIAVRLGVPQATVRKLIHDGDIHAVKNGNFWEISESALQEFAKKHPKKSKRF